MTEHTTLTETTVLRDMDGGSIFPGRYIWRGPASDPVFALQNCRDIVSSHVDVHCETPTSAVVLCERTTSVAGTIPSTMHGFTRWRIYGNGHAQHGFWYRGIDENNEHGRFAECSVYGCEFGWRFEGQQSKEHLLTHCRFESGATAVAAASGFQWISGTCAVASIGISLIRVGDPVLIQGVGFESCGRLLYTGSPGPSSDAQPIVLQNVRYAADQLHEDRGMIVLRHAGPLTILGGSLGNGDQPIPYVRLAGTGHQTVTCIGTHFGSFGAHLVHPVRVNPGVHDVITRLGCTYQTDATSEQRTTTLNTAPVIRP